MTDRIQEIARLRTVEFLVREAQRLAENDQAICAQLEAALDLILTQLHDETPVELLATEEWLDPDRI